VATVPGNSLPLDPNIQEAIDDFNRDKAKYIRQVTLLVLLKDLQEEIEDELKNQP
jgi:hypothetical protein